MKWSESNMRYTWLVVGLCLLFLALSGSATVPSDAQAIELGQSVEGIAPGAYYKVEVSTPGTLSVVMEEVPSQMTTWLIVMNEADDWLADKRSDNPGELIELDAPADAPGWYVVEVADTAGTGGPAQGSPYKFRVTMG
jgi:hypothetical protein